MAIKTYFTAKELRTILSNYALGDLQSFTPFEKGTEHTNILLATSQGKFAFRYYEKRSEEYVAFEINVLHFLAKYIYPCPGPIKNKGGMYTDIYKGKSFAIFEFLEGEHNDNSDNFKKIAKIIAKLHLITQSYQPPFSQAREAYNVTFAWNHAKENAKKINSQPEATERLNWFRNELDKLKIPDTMPKGVCHGDTNPTNFLYLNDDLSAVLDFDQASYTYLLYDIANMIYWWTWPNSGDLDFKKSKQLLQQYETVRELSGTEKEHLFDMLKMAILVGIGWFIHEEDFSNNKRKIESINTIGRDAFYKKLFVSQDK